MLLEVGVNVLLCNIAAPVPVNVTLPDGGEPVVDPPAGVHAVFTSNVMPVRLGSLAAKLLDAVSHAERFVALSAGSGPTLVPAESVGT